MKHTYKRTAKHTLITMDDNPLKKSFELDFKEEESNDSEKVDHDNAFDQSEGAASFLNEQSSPLSEDEDELPDEMKAQQFGSDEEEESDKEEEMEEADRGAVEDVLASLNDDYEPQGRNENEDRGAVEDVLRSLNGGGEQGKYDYHEGSHEGEKEEDEMDEVVASVLDELNVDDDGGLHENWKQRVLNEEDPCWDGYTMVGKKTDENGNEVPNCVPEEDAEDYDPNESALREDWKQRVVNEEAPCWDGYTMVGTKMEDGEEVPNCVPDDEVENYEESITQEDVLDAVLAEQTQELQKLDKLAEKVLSG